MNTWYDLEIQLLQPMEYYPIALFNRSDQNAGVDLHASQSVTIERAPEFIPFGIVARLRKVEQLSSDPTDLLKTDSHFWLVPRSSIYKTGLLMGNSVGVIDKNYRGELKAPVWSMTGESVVQTGDRLFQIVAPDMGWIRNISLVDSLPETDRGAGGFGSSGK